MARNRSKAVFPCKLKVLSDKIIRARNPLVLGVYVEKGQLRPGTPLFAWKTDPHGHPTPFPVGTVESCEQNGKEEKLIPKGTEAAIKIKAPGITFGRQITEEDKLFSLVCKWINRNYFFFMSQALARGNIIDRRCLRMVFHLIFVSPLKKNVQNIYTDNKRVD